MGQIEDGIGRALQREGRDVNFANAFWKEFPGGDLGREAMLDGTVLVLDAVLDARTDAERADDVADLLPPQYRDRYSGFFWKAFTAAALTAAYRLAEASERPIRFGCIAEELALHAFVEKAELVMEGWQSDGRLPESANGGFGTFLDAVAEDNDVSMLWQMELDGIDESEDGRKLGVASLRLVVSRQVVEIRHHHPRSSRDLSE